MKKPNYEIASLKQIQRGKIYRITKLRNPNMTTISYLSHFYKRGIRLWVLSTGDNFTYTIKLNLFKQLYMRTLDYVDLDNYKFEEINPTELPLHIIKATPLMERYLKEIYQKE